MGHIRRSYSESFKRRIAACKDAETAERKFRVNRGNYWRWKILYRTNGHGVLPGRQPCEIPSARSGGKACGSIVTTLLDGKWRCGPHAHSYKLEHGMATSKAKIVAAPASEQPLHVEAQQEGIAALIERHVAAAVKQAVAQERKRLQEAIFAVIIQEE